METYQTVRCPTCGNFAERRLLNHQQVPACEQVIQTACPVCDYLMVMSWPQGKVIEAYAPGQSSLRRPDPYTIALARPHQLTP